MKKTITIKTLATLLCAGVAMQWMPMAVNAENIIEQPADPKTTVSDNINTVAPDNTKKGTDISYSANVALGSLNIPLVNQSATITAEDVRAGKTLLDISNEFASTDYAAQSVSDLVMYGDLSIRKQDETDNM